MAVPKLLDMFEVAERLGCSRTHANDLMAAGELGPIVNISAKPRASKSRVSEEGVAAFIERRSRAIPAA